MCVYARLQVGVAALEAKVAAARAVLARGQSALPRWAPFFSGFGPSSDLEAAEARQGLRDELKVRSHGMEKKMGWRASQGQAERSVVVLGCTAGRRGGPCVLLSLLQKADLGAGLALCGRSPSNTVVGLSLSANVRLCVPAAADQGWMVAAAVVVVR